MRSEEYLAEIRKRAGLCRAVLKNITVENDVATFHLVTDVNYTQDDVAYAGEVSRRYAGGLEARATVVKSVPSEEGIRHAIADLLGTRFPAFAAFTRPENIGVTLGGAGGRFYITTAEQNSAEKNDAVLDEVCAVLQRGFCGTWTGEIRYAQAERGEIEREVPPEEYIFAPRFFEICDFSPIDGAKPEPDRAIYIADLNKVANSVTVCGEIAYIEERRTKNDKPYFSISISDGTGNLRTSYFSRKATVEKIRDLRVGSRICLTGDNELYNGGLSFRARWLDFGAPPKDFVPEQRPSRPVPAQYRAVFPMPEADLVQGDLFGKQSLPKVLTENTFVVFDLETTGLNRVNGMMDHIIEVGAVKIAGGKIAEKFSSFVACPVRIPPDIIDITHITDDMLIGAPPISDVIADFYKFTAGCSLVAHNAPFDCKFITYYGEQEGFLFDQRQYDTCTFAQEVLHLKNYQLQTVAEYFGFTFRHHRAYDDAFVTAKIFLELVKKKGGLPD